MALHLAKPFDIRFVDANGVSVVNYTGLKVWDADGRVLPARFETVEPERGMAKGP